MARLQARLNVARLAATRLGDYYPSVWCYVGSTAVHTAGSRGRLLEPSLEITDQLDDTPTIARFEVTGTSSPPVAGNAVYLAIGSSDHWLFSGNILRAELEQSRYVERPTWHIECEDNTRLMNRRLVRKKYTSTDAGVIITDLIKTYAPGFTANHIQASMGTIDEIEFTYERVSKAITRVCARVGANWYKDARDDIHAFTGDESGASAAAEINATGNHWDWNHQRDLSQIRTRVFVTGGGHAMSEPAIFGSTQLFLDGNEYLQGVNTIAVAPQYRTQAFGSVSGVEGYYEVASVNTSTNSVTFVILASSIGGTGFAGANKGAMVNVFATAQSTTLQSTVATAEGGDGIHEYQITDGRMTQAGALNLGRAHLGVYGQAEERGTFMTRDPSAEVGRRVTINAASRTVVTSVVARIQRVAISGFEVSTRSWSSTRTHKFPQRRVQYSTVALRDLDQVLGDLERERA